VKIDSLHYEVSAMYEITQAITGAQARTAIAAANMGVMEANVTCTVSAARLLEDSTAAGVRRLLPTSIDATILVNEPGIARSVATSAANTTLLEATLARQGIPANVQLTVTPKTAIKIGTTVTSAKYGQELAAECQTKIEAMVRMPATISGMSTPARGNSPSQTSVQPQVPTPAPPARGNSPPQTSVEPRLPFTSTTTALIPGGKDSQCKMLDGETMSRLDGAGYEAVHCR
jgi:hypothetical protein